MEWVWEYSKLLFGAGGVGTVALLYYLKWRLEKRAESGDTNKVYQKNIVASGDVVGRDKRG